jgi:cell wall-associated protease
VAVNVDQVTGEGTASGLQEHTSELLQGAPLITSFGRDAQGELYLVIYSGSILKITANPVTDVTLTPDQSAPQAPGTTITWTAAATGGVAPYQYKWWVYDGANWTATGWAGGNTFAWTPTVPHPNHHVAVWVRSAGDPDDAPDTSDVVHFPIRNPPVTSVMLTADRSSPQARGTTIMWTAAPAGGTAPYQYRWWFFDGATWTMIRDWSASNTFVWTPATEGEFHFGVWARSAGNTADGAEAAAAVPYTITAPALALTADRTAPQPPGTTITWTATASGGGAPHQYKFFVFDGANWTIARDWAVGNTFAWTPNVANANFYVGVWSRSAGNTADAPEASRAVAFPINQPPVTDVTLTADRTAPQPPGTTITWTAAPSGGVTPYQYKWWVYDGASWTMATGWTSSNTFMWTPTTPNANYQVGVWVKSAGNTADAAEAARAVPFAIAP